MRIQFTNDQPARDDQRETIADLMTTNVLHFESERGFERLAERVDAEYAEALRGFAGAFTLDNIADDLTVAEANHLIAILRTRPHVRDLFDVAIRSSIRALDGTGEWLHTEPLGHYNNAGVLALSGTQALADDVERLRRLDTFVR